MGNSNSIKDIYEIVGVKPIRKTWKFLLVQGITVTPETNVYKFASLINGMMNYEFRNPESITEYLRYHQNIYGLTMDNISKETLAVNLKDLVKEDFHYQILQNTSRNDRYIKLIINLDDATDEVKSNLEFIIDKLIPKTIETTILHHREKHGENVGRNCIINYVVNLYRNCDYILSFSSDEDLHCSLRYLYDSLIKFRNAEVPYKLCCHQLINGRIERCSERPISHHYGLWRMILPKNYIERYYLTFDVERTDDFDFLSSIAVNHSLEKGYFYNSNNEIDHMESFGLSKFIYITPREPFDKPLSVDLRMEFTNTLRKVDNYGGVYELYSAKYNKECLDDKFIDEHPPLPQDRIQSNLLIRYYVDDKPIIQFKTLVARKGRLQLDGTVHHEKTIFTFNKWNQQFVVD